MSANHYVSNKIGICSHKNVVVSVIAVSTSLAVGIISGSVILAGIVALGMALLLGILLADARHQAQEAKPLAKIKDFNLFTDACPDPRIVLFRLHCSQTQEGDADARFTSLQGSTQLLLGLGVEALLFRSSALLSQLHPDDQAILRPWLAGKADVGQHLQLLFRVSMPLQLATSPNSYRFVQLFAVFQPTAHAWDGVFVDVSEFVVARKEAEQATQAKSALLANISHELRTPLNGILGFSWLMEERLTDLQDVRDTRQIRETAESMARILNDILDFSKIDSGLLVLEKRRLGLKQLVESSAMLFKPMAVEKGLSFNILNEFEHCPVLLGDPTRMQQILQNLLSNAIKFTARGAISLNVYGHFLGADQVRLRFEVSDTGIGLSEFQQQRLFQRFVQADESINRLFGGTGLGLSIVKGLVEQLGGEISLESVEGLGSCFSVTLVLPVAGQECSEILPAVLPSKSLTVLVVDDYALNRRLLRRMLEKDGHLVVEANDGQTALAASLHQSFDLILMDIDMPVMDGHASAKAIREQSELNRTTYICALSGLVFQEDQEKTSLAGMDEHLPKPISFDALRDVIRKVGQIEMV